jgi:hypothetical protein
MLVLRLVFTLCACSSFDRGCCFSFRLSVIAPPAITEWIRLDPPGAESLTTPVAPDGGRRLLAADYVHDLDQCSLWTLDQGSRPLLGHGRELPPRRR